MPMLFADKITHLTAARYFAARGFEWICFDLSDESGLKPAAVAAIREWVEGPRMALYLPFGLRSLAPEMVAALAPEGLVIGHFAPRETYPDGYTLIKEWRVENHEEGLRLADAIRHWPEADLHLLRCEDLDTTELFALLEVWRPLAATHPLLLASSLCGADWEALVRSGPEFGHVFRAPEESQVGVLSFEALDDLLDPLD